MPDIEELLLPHISRLKTYQGVSPSETLAEEGRHPPGAGHPPERQ